MEGPTGATTTSQGDAVAVHQEEKKDDEDKEDDNQMVGDDEQKEIESQMKEKGFSVENVKYSTAARWTYTKISLEKAMETLKEWAKGLLGFDGAPDMDQELWEPKGGFCLNGCALCELKQAYKESVTNFETAQREFEEQNQQNLLVVEGDEERENNNQPDDGMDIEAELIVEQVVEGEERENNQPDDEMVSDAELVEQIQREYHDIIALATPLLAESIVQRLLADRKEKEAAVRREEAAVRREEAAVRREEAAVRREEAAVRREEAAVRREVNERREKEAAVEREVNERRDKLNERRERLAVEVFSAAKDVKALVSEISSVHLCAEDEVCGLAIWGNNTVQSYKGTDVTPGSNVDQNLKGAMPSITKKTFVDENPKLEIVDANEDLKAFHSALSEGFKGAERIDKNEDFATQIEETQTKILESPLNESMEDLVVPIATGLEQEGCHPLLAAIMYRIASMQKSNDDDDTRTPVSNNISHEQPFWVDSKTAGRRIDFIVQQVQERLKTVLSFSCFVPIEAKPLGRKHMNLSDLLHEEGAHQVVGHLAKQIFQYLNLGGIGCNHICRGAVLTLASVEILEMELSGVGTVDARVTIRRTQPHLLFDKETTEHLLGEGIDDMDFKFDVDNPHRGLEMLATLMHIPSREKSPFSRRGSNVVH